MPALTLIGNPTQHAVDFPRFLKAISMVESGNRDTAIGWSKDGTVVARGRYQLTKAVWQRWSNRPWQLAHNLSHSQLVAEKHLLWLDQNIPRVYIEETIHRPFALAWAWRAGLSGWLNRDHPFKPGGTYPTNRATFRDYANRVYNLYLDTP
jgi:hypothetical protein